MACTDGEQDVKVSEQSAISSWGERRRFLIETGGAGGAGSPRATFDNS